jgi:LmbE family N-acetylglucosaminyl deacetylase
MTFQKDTADLFIPDGTGLPDALARTTHLGIGAHQDDLEFMAYQGILECFRNQKKWFSGVVCTNGAGSSRTGPYADCSDGELCRIRRQEQRLAAQIGQYGFMAQLDFSSAEIRKSHAGLVADLTAILTAAQPEIVYTHNPADKHDTHIQVLGATLKAIRALPAARRPRALYGCEVWRGLDWVNDEEKVVFDVGGKPHFAAALNGVFDSQIGGGKRYDLATEGRRRANATYANPRQSDQSAEATLALDLTPLILNDNLDLVEFTLGYIDRFRADVETRLRHIAKN